MCGSAALPNSRIGCHGVLCCMWSLRAFSTGGRSSVKGQLDSAFAAWAPFVSFARLRALARVLSGVSGAAWKWVARPCSRAEAEARRRSPESDVSRRFFPHAFEDVPSIPSSRSVSVGRGVGFARCLLHPSRPSMWTRFLHFMWDVSQRWIFLLLKPSCSWNRSDVGRHRSGLRSFSIVTCVVLWCHSPLVTH